MTTFDIQTPALKNAVSLFEQATDGTHDVAKANSKIAAGRGIVSAVKQELNVRLSLPKLSRAERV